VKEKKGSSEPFFFKAELYKVFEELGAKPDLLACVASWGTTQTQEQVWKSSGPTTTPAISSASP